MANFAWQNGLFWQDGEPFNIHAGEVHYFRIPPEDWAVRLDQLKAANHNAVSVYMPWAFHEPREGVFDFAGPLDLARFLDLAAERDLLVLARPGPYVYSELIRQGIPPWFYETYPEAVIRTWNGESYTESRKPVVSYLHPAFLEKVGHWFEEVAGVIKPYLTSNDGPIVMLQLDNEVPGIQIWYNWDLESDVLGFGKGEGHYIDWLKARYETLDALNEAWGTAYADWSGIMPPDSEHPAACFDLTRYHLSAYTGEYFTRLGRMWRDLGVDVPFYHNAYSPNGILEAFGGIEIARKELGEPIHLGLDAYYTFQHGINSRSLSYYEEYGPGMACAFGSRPASVWEFEGGNWRDEPRITAPEMKIWTQYAAYGGWQSWAYYVFAGGTTSPEQSAVGSSYEFQAPVASSGATRSHYEAIREALAHVQARPWLETARRVPDLALGVLPHYDLYYRSAGGNVPSLDPDDLAWLFFRHNLGYEIIPLARWEHDIWQDRPVIWVKSGPWMDGPVQENLIAYIRGGGNLILSGDVPVRDWHNRPARQIWEAAQIEKGPARARFHTNTVSLIDNGTENAAVSVFVGQGPNEPRAIQMPGTVRAWMPDGRPAIVSKKIGEGTLTVIPFNIDPAVDSQAQLVHAILGPLGVRPRIYAHRLHGLRLITERGPLVIFVNYLPETVTETVHAEGSSLQLSLEPYSIAEWWLSPTAPAAPRRIE